MKDERSGKRVKDIENRDREIGVSGSQRENKTVLLKDSGM